MKFPYDDIIDLPHHVSKNHPPMPLSARAVQFAPYAALAGHVDALAEKARPVIAKLELDAQEAEDLDRRFKLLIAQLPGHPEVTIRYFVPDIRKSGGAYFTVTGTVQDVSVADRVVVMTDGTVIPMDEVVSLDGDFAI